LQKRARLDAAANYERAQVHEGGLKPRGEWSSGKMGERRSEPWQTQERGAAGGPVAVERASRWGGQHT